MRECEKSPLGAQRRRPAAQHHTSGPDTNNRRVFVCVCFLCGASCVSVALLRSFSWCKRRELQPRGFGILQTQTELTSCHPPICTLAAREVAPRLSRRNPAHHPPVGLFLYGGAGSPSEDNRQNGLLGRIGAWVKTDGGLLGMGLTLLYHHNRRAGAKGKKTELRSRDCPPGGTGAQEHT